MFLLMSQVYPIKLFSNFFIRIIMRYLHIILTIIISTLSASMISGQTFSLKDYERSANNGDLETCTAIGQWYANGNSEMGISIDYSKAMYWYKKAADQGYGKALNNLAYLYLDGKGTEKNVNKGIDLLEQAYNSGNVFSAQNLALIYYYGDYVTKDWNKVFEWADKAYDKGKYLLSARLLANCYHNGNGVQRDDKKAYDLVKTILRCCDYGPDYAYEFYLMGTFCHHGYGTEVDLKKAKYYYNTAIHYNYQAAKGAYGELMYEQENYADAFTNLTEVAEAGGATSSQMNILSSCYRYGFGTTKDIKKANFWLNQASAAGNNSAQELLNLLDGIIKTTSSQATI